MKDMNLLQGGGSTVYNDVIGRTDYLKLGPHVVSSQHNPFKQSILQFSIFYP